MTHMYLTTMKTVILTLMAWSLIFFKQRLDEMEDTALVTEWTSNIEEAYYDMFQD